jgi:integrase/recombinase XerD
VRDRRATTPGRGKESPPPRGHREHRSDNTIDAYLRFVRALQRFHERPLDELGEAEVRAFLEYMLTEHKLQPRSLTGYIAAFKFLYATVLRRPEVTATLAFPKKTKRLPRILSHSEVLALIDSAETLRTRAYIMLGYGSGLRMSEVRHLQPQDIDSRRGVIVVRGGKGNKDRIAPLPERTLATLREYWRETRPQGPWLFPGVDPSKPMSKHAIGDRFNRARFLAGLSAPSASTRCDTLSPRTCWRPAWTSWPSRPCSGTPISRPPWSTSAPGRITCSPWATPSTDSPCSAPCSPLPLRRPAGWGRVRRSPALRSG